MIETWVADSPLWILALRAAALVTIGAGGVAALLAVAGAFSRHAHARRLQALELERFQERLRGARMQRVERGRTREAWSGYRKFRVTAREDESPEVATFTLVAHDGKPIPSYAPGQYLTFRVRTDPHASPAVRCYSLSHRPGDGTYRVSIKRVHADGTSDRASVSTFFHERVATGDILDVKAPAGDFALDVFQPRPLVLIGGGIGVTPLLAMLDALTARSLDREVWLFYGVREPADALRLDWLRARVRDGQGRLHVHLCQSRADEDALPADDVLVHHAGHVSVSLLESLLPSVNYDFHLCGPAPMMAALTRGLVAWGVGEEQLHLESFGPASVEGAASARADERGRAACRVVFARSGVERAWDPAAGNLLRFAEQHGVEIETGCRAGSCGSCEVAVKDGEVRHLETPGAPPEPGSCLACLAVPETDVVLEA